MHPMGMTEEEGASEKLLNTLRDIDQEIKIEMRDATNCTVLHNNLYTQSYTIEQCRNDTDTDGA